MRLCSVILLLLLCSYRNIDFFWVRTELGLYIEVCCWLLVVGFKKKYIEVCRSDFNWSS